MSITLEEAIEHAKEVAELNENIAYNTEPENWMDIAQCEKCAEEHRQLADWLRELKERRKQPEITCCKDCRFNVSSHKCLHPESFFLVPDDDFYCGYAERRSEEEIHTSQPEIIHCGECRFREIRGNNGYCDHITGEEIMVWKDEYCSWAEKRTDEQV